MLSNCLSWAQIEFQSSFPFLNFNETEDILWIPLLTRDSLPLASAREEGPSGLRSAPSPSPSPPVLVTDIMRMSRKRANFRKDTFVGWHANSFYQTDFFAVLTKNSLWGRAINQLNWKELGSPSPSLCPTLYSRGGLKTAASRPVWFCSFASCHDLNILNKPRGTKSGHCCCCWEREKSSRF